MLACRVSFMLVDYFCGPRFAEGDNGRDLLHRPSLVCFVPGCQVYIKGIFAGRESYWEGVILTDWLIQSSSNCLCNLRAQQQYVVIYYCCLVSSQDKYRCRCSVW